MTDFKDNSAGFLANTAARLFASALQAEIRPLGIAPAQFMVLLELWDHDGATQSTLARALDVEQATMAKTLDRMDRDGLIRRRSSADDRRVRDIFLTEKARALKDEAVAAARVVNARALADLSEADRARMLASLKTVIAALRRHR